MSHEHRRKRGGKVLLRIMMVAYMSKQLEKQHCNFQLQSTVHMRASHLETFFSLGTTLALG